MLYVIKIRDWKMGFRTLDIKLRNLRKLNLIWRMNEPRCIISWIIAIRLKLRPNRSKRKPCWTNQPTSTWSNAWSTI